MKYGIHFAPYSNPKGGEAGLKVRVSTPGFVVLFNVGYRVTTADWNKDTQRLKRNTFHGKNKIPASVINDVVSKWEAKVGEIMNSHDTLTEAQFRSLFNKEMNRKKSCEEDVSVIKRYLQFMREQSVECSWTYGTQEKHRAVLAHLKDFNSKITYEDLDDKGLLKFQAWLVTKAEHRNTTAKKDMGVMKWFLNWSYQNGYCKQNKFMTFKSKLKTVKKRVIFLTWDELMLFYSHEFKSDTYERVRDAFCFCCFTGLRYSDMSTLKKSDVDEYLINLTTIKTDDAIRIDLNKYSREIYNKYKDTDGELLFNVMSNAKMNKYLKEAAKEVGINSTINDIYYKGAERIEVSKPKYKYIKTHVGRSTFICNALVMGIPPNVIMKWTGHSSYKAMMPYIDIADKERKSMMKKFDER